jgi:hypothetical protein
LRQGFPFSVALEQVSLCPMSLPNGNQPLIARRTIEDWWYDYQHGGFAALTPKARADRGQPRTLTAQQQMWILEQAQGHPAVPVKVLCRRWREQDLQQPADPRQRWPGMQPVSALANRLDRSRQVRCPEH